MTIGAVHLAPSTAPWHWMNVPLGRRTKCDGAGAGLLTFAGKATKAKRSVSALLPGFKEVMNPDTWTEIKSLDNFVPVLNDGMTILPEVPYGVKDWVKEWLTSAKDYAKRVEEYEEAFQQQHGE